MGIEIERKYLVNSDSYKSSAKSVSHIIQGYLSRNPERTVRVRILNQQGFITIKGLTKSLTRLEFEYEIPLSEAKELILLCPPPILEKDRYIVEYDGYIWEIDEFKSPVSSLTMAEVEMKSESENPLKPPFIGKEVTGNPKYYNSNITSGQFKV